MAKRMKSAMAVVRGNFFPDRVRFNWGFHDAVAECERKSRRDVSDHFDAPYAEGYMRGCEAHNAVGVKAISSESAWQCREDSRKDAAARAKRMRDARPPAATVRV
jgi:hypothetical protein